MKDTLVPLSLLFAVSLLAAETRYSNVIYFDQLGEKPPVLRATQTVSISTTPDLRNAHWSLFTNHPVLLLGWSDRIYYIEARLNIGAVRGWADPALFEAIAPATIADWKKKAVATAERRALIAQKKVGVGFSPAEIIAALGKPDRVDTTVAEAGRQELWHYTITTPIPYYEYYLGPNNQTIVNRSFHRTEAVGSRTVTLQNDRVIQYNEDTPKIDRTPRPLFLGYSLR